MEVLFNAGQISSRIQELGREISDIYRGQGLVVIGVLKGGFIFMSDLVRSIEIPLMIDFARLSSYGHSTSPEGEVTIVSDIHMDIRGKHVLLVDDILDTGHSLFAYKRTLEQRGPVSVKICTLIDKTYRRSVNIQPDFYGFRIKNGFIVGYGLDYGEQYRGLPEIHVLNSLEGGEPA